MNYHNDKFHPIFSTSYPPNFKIYNGINLLSEA
jgi:hypothetical protein